MRILRIIPSMDPTVGGPCQGIRNSIPELAKLGASNEVVSFDSQDSKFLENDGFVINCLGPAIGPWAYNKELIPWLLANLGRFDVVIVHGLWQYHSYAAFKALTIYKKTNIDKIAPRLYVMPHGMLDPWFQRAKGRKFKAIRNWIFWKIIEGKVVNNADGVLFTCEAELVLARETFTPYNPKREINVSYGIQSPPPLTLKMSQDLNEKYPFIFDKPYILFLSRINYKKGVDILIKAYSEIIVKESELGVVIPRLVIAGPGLDSDYGKKIQNLISESEVLQGKIFFPGMLTGSHKWSAFYMSDAFILPSHQENFGIAVAEALACGTPVLISNQVNIWREIEAGGAGIIDGDHLDGVVRLLKTYINLSDEEKTEMGEKAKLVFRKNFAIGPAAMKFSNGIGAGI